MDIRSFYKSSKTGDYLDINGKSTKHGHKNNIEDDLTVKFEYWATQLVFSPQRRLEDVKVA